MGCDGTAEYLSTIGALGRLCWYKRVRKEHSGGCAGTKEYERSTPEAVPVQQSTIGTLVLVQQNTKGALGWLCWYSRVLQEPLGSCAGTAE